MFQDLPSRNTITAMPSVITNDKVNCKIVRTPENNSTERKIRWLLTNSHKHEKPTSTDFF